jgi:hypothetical protein
MNRRSWQSKPPQNVQYRVSEKELKGFKYTHLYEKKTECCR